MAKKATTSTATTDGNTENDVNSYLDDMTDLKEGDSVVCRTGVAEEGFTEGRVYHIGPERTLMNDFGRVVMNSSARFAKEE